jgi:preprotein translocase subunit SecA
MAALSDADLAAQTPALRSKLAAGASLDDLLPEAFAVVREAATRVLGLRPFDVQLIGGAVLHAGQIAEMRTGEGKTLVAVLPAYLNALAGQGVHVVTVNDYLARRDSEWVGQVHRFLGLTVGLVQQGQGEAARRAAYACDVTYVTNSELGFDYLRDNLATAADDLVLRPFNFCVIDEVDSILIDEARTPLIISGPADKPSEKYYRAAKLAGALARDVHYTVDEKQKSVLLTEDGYEAAEDVLAVADLYDPREQWASYLINALKAKELYTLDTHYIVRGDEVIIVDEFTGRTMPGRRWGDGLHQAVEAKEKLPIQNETVTLASISYQNFFRGFPKLAGMTGTAATEAQEFASIYDLAVTPVPTNRGLARADNPDVVFRTEAGKWGAVVTEVQRMVETGRPCLVGTTSVERSEALSAALTDAGIKHQLLNAKPENVEREAEVVAQAGRRGAVTISTNMAGRGTDILLGGNPEFMARLRLRADLMPAVVSAVASLEAAAGSGGAGGRVKPRESWAVSPDLFPCALTPATEALIADAVKAAVAAWGERALSDLEAEDRLAVACERSPSDDPTTLAIRAAFRAAEAEYEAVTSAEKAEVVALGGLHVVGTERHESRRIDNQLRGRAGRQGDPGSTRFFLSLEDALFRVFGGDKVKGLMTAFAIEDLPIESRMLTDALNEAQRKVEAYFFDARRQLFEFDQVLNTQRDRLYGERRRALLAADLGPLYEEYAARTVDDILEANVDPATPGREWALDALAAKLAQYCPAMGGGEGGGGDGADPVTPASLAAAAKIDTSGGASTSTSSSAADDAPGDFEALRAYVRARGLAAYRAKVAAVDAVEPGLAADAARFFVLAQTDNLWKEHLQAMKFLQQAVGLRGYAQRDPLAEYKLEGYQLFVEMMAQLRRNAIYSFYVFEPKPILEEGGASAGEKKAKAAGAKAGTGVGSAKAAKAASAKAL